MEKKLNTEQRIRICRMIEKMQEQAECSKRLGLENTSKFMYLEKMGKKDNKTEEGK